jgi:hypothetical protein
VEFLVDKVALGQVFPLVLWFPPVNVIPLVLHYLEKKLIIIFLIFITGCGASVAASAGSFYTHTKKRVRGAIPPFLDIF